MKSPYLIAASLLLLGCESKTLFQESPVVQEKIQHPAEQKKFVKSHFEYKILPHDRIRITIYNHPELSSRAMSEEGILVDGNGMISLPLIGPVKVTGLTQPEAARKIQYAYSRYLKRSSVYLEVLNKRAYVIGEVKNAGPIKLPNEQTTLLEAISSVGGFSDHANKEKIFIIRKHRQGSEVDLIDLTNHNSLRYASMMIHPNDIVYVSPDNIKANAMPAVSIFRLVADAMLPFVRYRDIIDD